jgi:Flp pilus assembly protein TadD/outer membrane protein OmpA-like peptidoglycan-associated protein
MKNKSVKVVLATVSTAVLLASCGGLGKMVKNSNQITYEVTPKPLEMHGDSVALTIKGTYPAKFFNKKAMLAVTPVLTYAGGEKEYKTVNYKGEKSNAEGTIVNFEKGGAFNYSSKVPYHPEMRVSELQLKATASIKSKSKSFPVTKLADGVVATPSLVMNDDKPSVGADKFTETVPRIAEAKIQFVIQQSNVRGTELSKPEVKALSEFVKKGKEKGYIFNNIEVSAYSSPDGEERLNAGLAERRAEETAKFLTSELKRMKLEAAKRGDLINKTSTPEDWEGFKSLVEKSEIKDKDLILRVLSMYQDPMQREQEMKNMAATYTALAEKILPELRRSKIRINAEEKSRSKEHITRLAKTHPDSLSVEEILYAATLTNDLENKLSIYRTAERIYANDWRTTNNIGYVYLLQNKLGDAKSQFEKAGRIAGENNAVIKNNLGVIAHLQGDRSKAAELYREASTADKNAMYNLGIIGIKNGNYSAAVTNMAGHNTFNAALANTLAGNNDAAAKALEASADKETAMGHYLRAVIAARAGNANLVSSNLKSAISKDPSLREKAKTDLEFAKYKASAEFTSAVN